MDQMFYITIRGNILCRSMFFQKLNKQWNKSIHDIDMTNFFNVLSQNAKSIVRYKSILNFFRFTLVLEIGQLIISTCNKPTVPLPLLMTLFLQGNGLNIIQWGNETLNECICRSVYVVCQSECVIIRECDTPLQGRLASLFILNVIIIKKLYSSASV